MFDFKKSNDNNSFYALSFYIFCLLLIETNVFDFKKSNDNNSAANINHNFGVFFV